MPFLPTLIADNIRVLVTVISGTGPGSLPTNSDGALQGFMQGVKIWEHNLDGLIS